MSSSNQQENYSDFTVVPGVESNRMDIRLYEIESSCDRSNIIAAIVCFPFALCICFCCSRNEAIVFKDEYGRSVKL